MIFLTNVDDCIIAGPPMADIDMFVNSMENCPEKLTLNDEGDIDTFLGIEITHLKKKIFETHQLCCFHVINNLIKEIIIFM